MSTKIAIAALTFLAVSIFGSNTFAQATEVVVPYGTQVVCEVTGDITLDDKPGKEVGMIVQKDVEVKGKIVIAKGTPVQATIRINKKPKGNYYTGEEYTGELLIDIFSTKAVDGSEIKFSDVYLQIFAYKNRNWFDKKRKWLLDAGTVKNCATRLTYTVKVP
jgi:hypothetical protein